MRKEGKKPTADRRTEVLELLVIGIQSGGLLVDLIDRLVVLAPPCVKRKREREEVRQI